MKNLKKSIAVLFAILVMVSCSTGVMNEGRLDVEGLDTVNSGISASSGEVKEGYIRIGDYIEKISYVTIDGINLYEGDIEISDSDIYPTAEAAQSRALVRTKHLWPNKTVYYQISSEVYNVDIIREAISIVQTEANIDFIEDIGPKGFILFIPSPYSWSSSKLGHRGGMQELRLAKGATTGTAIHEIMHALGVHHEQSRGDRDQYVTIHYDNIKSGFVHNFEKHSGPYYYDIGGFDFDSIMLYSSFACSKNDKPTITKKGGATFRVNRKAMSRGDIQGLKILYPEEAGRRFDAALNHPTSPNIIYFFKGDKYYKYDFNRDRIIGNHKISYGWSGIPDNIDAAVNHPADENIIYFFKGNKYYLYDFKKDRVIRTSLISDGFHGIPDNIDAAVNHSSSRDIIHFFKGVAYYRYDLRKNEIQKLNYIKMVWDKIPDFLSAAVKHPARSCETYFFMDDKYYKYDTDKDRLMSGYPAEISIGWLGF